MPRGARRKSESGIYHIMLRGINRQVIFEDEEDQVHFIETLRKYKEVCNYTVYAYCLMGNHIHILLKEGTEELERVLKRITGSYAYWYNQKYYRSGHLFQDRFKSEPVEDEAYFMTVLRYIHQNPVKAGLCVKPEEYRFSSYNEYLLIGTLVDNSLALSITSKEELIRFHNEENEDQCLEIADENRLNDADAKRLIARLTKCKSAADFQRLDRETRNRHIARIYRHGISIRQISRLTGLSKKVVETNILRDV